MLGLALRTSVPHNTSTLQSHAASAKALPGLPTGSRASQAALGSQSRRQRSFVGTPVAPATLTLARPGRAPTVVTHAVAPQAAEALARLCSHPFTADAARALGADGVDAINKLCQASTQGASGGDMLGMIANVAFPLILVGSLFSLMRGRGMGGPGGPGGVFDFGKSRAKRADENESTVTFDDVAGIDYALGELREIVNFLKDPARYRAMGAQPPKGVLLEGDPGVGKTLLAQAIAGEAKVPFYSCNGSEFVEMFVGVGASRVRDLFARAKMQTPCIIFIDELDAIGRQRGGGPQVGGNSEVENTLNQLLGEMDGFGKDSGIIVIAATNRADVLDQALLRPGRFDRRLRINAPDREGRLHILKVHARNRKFAKNVEFEKVAARTMGMTGADLNNLLNEAVMRACTLGKEEATLEDIDWAYERVMAGALRPGAVVSDTKKKLVAYHEAGHALVGMLLGQEIASVSIVPRDRAAGLTWIRPDERTEEDGIETLEDLENRLVVALGGRVAEEFIYGPKGVTTGAGSDLQRVSQIAYTMVDSCAFGKNVPPRATLLSGNGGRFGGMQVSEKELARRSDAVDDLAKTAAQRATKLIRDHKDDLHAIAKALIADESITGEQLKLIREGRPWNEVVKSKDCDELDLEEEGPAPEIDENAIAATVTNAFEKAVDDAEKAAEEAAHAAHQA